MIDVNTTAPRVSTVMSHFRVTGSVSIALVKSVEPSAATELGPRRLI